MNGNINGVPVIVLGIADLVAPLGGDLEAQLEETRKYIDTYDLTFPVWQDNDVENLLGVSDATAERYLNELEAEGKVKQTGETGRGVFYTKA